MNLSFLRKQESVIEYEHKNNIDSRFRGNDVQEVFGLETAVKRLYEAMFLVDSTESAQNWDVVIATIKTILERADAEIVSIRNWAERKLAYEINRKTRGTYILCYFRADGERIRNIEKDVQLSEQIMRVLILSAETREKEAVEGDPTLQKDRKMRTQEDIPATEAEKEKQKADQETVEKVSTQQEVEEAGEPEQSAEPAAADASPVRNSLKSNNMNEKRKISNGASEPEQPEQPETEKDTSD